VKPSLRLCLAGAGLALAFGCKPEVQSSPPNVDAQTQAEAEVPRLVWLRNSALLDASLHTVLGQVDAPTRVELFAGGRVRAAPGSGSTIDGYLDPAQLRSPVDGQGVALYAQRSAELHHGTPDGPVIGAIAAGAFVSVAVLPGGFVQIAVPGFTLPSSSPAAPVLAVVRADVLGAEPQTLEPSARVGTSPGARLVRDFPAGVPLEPAAASNEPFAASLCGDARVLAEQPPRALIAQAHAGIELRGWVDADVHFHRGPVRCTLRQVFREHDRLISIDGTTAADRAVVPAVPPGYVSADPTHAEPLLPRLRHGDSLHWLVRGESGATCQAWAPSAVRPAPEAGTFEGALRSIPRKIQGTPVTPSFTLKYRAAAASAPGELVLFGPHFKTSRGAESNAGGYRAGSVYTIVGATPNALRVFPSSLSASVVAWHPDDEEHWFTSDAACQAAARAAAPALQKGDPNPPGGFHINPFPELDG
jgi:hypothetical protein